MNKNKILSGGGKNLTGGGKWGWRGREAGGEGEGSGVKGGGKRGLGTPLSTPSFKNYFYVQSFILLQRESLDSGTDWSLPWDYNKTMVFLRSKPLLYDTSKINKTFPNLLQVTFLPTNVEWTCIP